MSCSFPLPNTPGTLAAWLQWSLCCTEQWVSLSCRTCAVSTACVLHSLALQSSERQLSLLYVYSHRATIPRLGSVNQITSKTLHGTFPLSFCCNWGIFSQLEILLVTPQLHLSASLQTSFVRISLCSWPWTEWRPALQSDFNKLRNFQTIHCFTVIQVGTETLRVHTTDLARYSWKESL
jgi:hypothetical protein